MNEAVSYSVKSAVDSFLRSLSVSQIVGRFARDADSRKCLGNRVLVSCQLA